MTTSKRINEAGIKALKTWIETTSLPDHSSTDARALDAWCNEAEESMGNGNPPMVEMSHLHTVSGATETFTVPENAHSTSKVCACAWPRVALMR